MDREFLADLFSAFGPVTIRRMFSGHGISVDGVNFAISIKAGLFLRAEPATEARFAAEGCKPFEYETRARRVMVRSYWQMPERLYDDPEELADWARMAFSSAQKAAIVKRPRKRPSATQPKSVRTGSNAANAGKSSAQGKAKKAQAKGAKTKTRR